MEYEEVSDDYKKSVPNYGEYPIVKLLLSGSVLKVPKNTRISKLARFATSKNLKVRTRTNKDSLIIWLEESKAQGQHDDVVD